MALPFQFEPEFAEDQMSDISNCSEEEESEGRQTDRRSFFVVHICVCCKKLWSLSHLTEGKDHNTR